MRAPIHLLSCSAPPTARTGPTLLAMQCDIESACRHSMRSGPLLSEVHTQQAHVQRSCACVHPHATAHRHSSTPD
eukprot:1143713-Pleurochrysis_carterae.AAC.1